MIKIYWKLFLVNSVSESNLPFFQFEIAENINKYRLFVNNQFPIVSISIVTFRYNLGTILFFVPISSIIWQLLARQKSSQKIGKRIDTFIDNEWDNIPLYMEDMSDKEKAEFILKLLPYATPKYSSRIYQTDVTEDWGF